MYATFDELLAACRAGRAVLRTDSRAVGPGDVFVALPGTRANGASFAAQAVAAGAACILCARGETEALAGLGVPIVGCDDVREALGQAAAALYGTDRRSMTLLAVTGTNGKTTSSYMLEHLFSGRGKVGVLGTVNYRYPGHVEPAPLTTPDVLTVHGKLSDMARAGVTAAILEVSSHALDQDRVAGVPFDGALFTNLTRDHLDFHGDMESYYAAKARLFLSQPRPDKAAAVNADDAWGRRLLDARPGALSYGFGDARLKGEVLEAGPSGLVLSMSFGGGRWRLASPLVGAFNAANLLGVQALGLALGLSPADLAVLETFQGVPGRLERVGNPCGLHVFVDYAHTPDALENVLAALRKAGFARIVTVFGCGGNRDRGKRPVMGRAVAQGSDVAVLTSDNPRDEDPGDIIRDVLPGLDGWSGRLLVEADRRKATAMALEEIGRDDALLVAGKGHEDYQLVRGVRHPYSDQQVLREIMGCA
ncbi:MAG: UDP-N-acetylmuramoyl-L-alanyl-D-glutamate--2,6-diaminopimelate ligase [Desulfovibrio sp.]|jgi:UDP-N-acetylmuramoyl-L-alanyl-D-glutamate--2,6-diaminopimelate ligase|nr:UDP-N-acetylmuramoyl-L-alanyl-D-glutamate--2,6-diaminopimelate ligase [Desulfovibrio sp.]